MCPPEVESVTIFTLNDPLLISALYEHLLTLLPPYPCPGHTPLHGATAATLSRPLCGISWVMVGLYVSSEGKCQIVKFPFWQFCLHSPDIVSLKCEKLRSRI